MRALKIIAIVVVIVVVIYGLYVAYNKIFVDTKQDSEKVSALDYPNENNN